MKLYASFSSLLFFGNKVLFIMGVTYFQNSREFVGVVTLSAIRICWFGCTNVMITMPFWEYNYNDFLVKFIHKVWWCTKIIIIGTIITFFCTIDMWRIQGIS